MMQSVAIRLSALAGITALGAVGVSLALLGLGVPLVASAMASAVAAGAAQYGAARYLVPTITLQQTVSATSDARLAAYRAHTATLRHDLRGVLSPMLMMSDRLVNHTDPTVKKAGQIVVRSIDRATALLEANREALGGGVTPPSSAAPDDHGLR